MEDLNEILKIQFNLRMETTLEQVLKMQFPKMKNLQVDCKDEICNVQFDEGEYSKQEVEEFITQFRK